MVCRKCKTVIGREACCYEIHDTRNWGGADGPRSIICSVCWEADAGPEGRK